MCSEIRLHLWIICRALYVTLQPWGCAVCITMRCPAGKENGPVQSWPANSQLSYSWVTSTSESKACQMLKCELQCIVGTSTGYSLAMSSHQQLTLPLLQRARRVFSQDGVKALSLFLQHLNTRKDLTAMLVTRCLMVRALHLTSSLYAVVQWAIT